MGESDNVNALGETGVQGKRLEARIVSSNDTEGRVKSGTEESE